MSAGAPQGLAMFGVTTASDLYFSPATQAVARNWFQSRRAAPCAAPSPHSTTVLLVGRDKAWELLRLPLSRVEPDIDLDDVHRPPRLHEQDTRPEGAMR